MKSFKKLEQENKSNWRKLANATKIPKEIQDKVASRFDQRVQQEQKGRSKDNKRYFSN